MGHPQNRPSRLRGALAAVLALFTLLASAVAAAPPRTEPLWVESGSRRVPFQVELAVSPEERERGLMFRREVPERTGMLFYFPEEIIARFWMVNTLVPLDALFVSSDGRIVKIVERMEPRSERIVSSDRPVRAVLELGGGEARKEGIQVGDRVVHPLLAKRK